jgi:hypothetical protein
MIMSYEEALDSLEQENWHSELSAIDDHVNKLEAELAAWKEMDHQNQTVIAFLLEQAPELQKLVAYEMIDGA